VFSSGTAVSSTNKTAHHDITEILLKVRLNTIDLNQTTLLSKIYSFSTNVLEYAILFVKLQ